MGFGKRSKRNYRDNNYKKKGRARPKLAVIGAISLAIGILLVHFIGIPTMYSEGKFDDNHALTAGMIGIMAGVVMLLLSLSKKRQGQLASGMESISKALEPDCNCCKCNNCDMNHNHWTHD